MLNLVILHAAILICALLWAVDGKAQSRAQWLSFPGPEGLTEVDPQSFQRVNKSIMFDAIVPIRLSPGDTHRILQRVFTGCNGGFHLIVASAVPDGFAATGGNTDMLNRTTFLALPAVLLDSPAPFISPELRKLIIEMCRTRAPSTAQVEIPISLTAGSTDAYLLRPSTLRVNGVSRDVWLSRRRVNQAPPFVLRDAKGDVVPLLKEIDGITVNRKELDEKTASRMKFRFDCKRERAGSTSETDYSESGEVTRAFSVQERQIEERMADIVPDSVLEPIFRVVCRL